MEKEIGKVFRYFSNISVAAIELSDTLKVGDKIAIRGATTNFDQVVDSMQEHNQDIDIANVGAQIAIKTMEKVRENDTVYLIEE